MPDTECLQQFIDGRWMDDTYHTDDPEEAQELEDVTFISGLSG